MAFARGIKTALSLLRKRDWREFIVRVRVALGQIDLKLDSREESERTHFYSDSGGSELDKVMAAFNLRSDDAIIDFGCGKGGALITLAKYPFSKITGVEISAELVDIARNNLRKLHIDNVTVVCCDAADFTELDDYTYVYFFNPFPCIVMKSVIDNIKMSLARNRRKVTIIYLNPDCHDVIVADSPFVKQTEFYHTMHKYYIYSNKQR
jgi:SAM-dependent methyltransferase